MNTLQNCIHLQNEKPHSAKQGQGLGRGEIPTRWGHRQSPMRKHKTGLLLLHNGLPESREQDGSGDTTPRNSRSASHPDSYLITHHREIAPRSTGELTPKNHISLPSVNFTPLRWYVGMSATFLIALNRFKMRRAKNFNNLIFFFDFYHQLMFFVVYLLRSWF